MLVSLFHPRRPSLFFGSRSPSVFRVTTTSPPREDALQTSHAPGPLGRRDIRPAVGRGVCAGGRARLCGRSAHSAHSGRNALGSQAPCGPLWPRRDLRDGSGRILFYFTTPDRLLFGCLALTFQYTAAVKTSTLEPTAKAIAALADLLAKDAKLGTILTAPTLSAADKAAIVVELQKATGSTGQPTVTHFMGTLAENNRLGLLGGVTAKFGELMRAAHGEVEMVVTSAQPLDSKTLGRLEAAVAKSAFAGAGAGKKLKVTNVVNPDILGGLVVEVGDRTIDLSVSAKVAKLNKLLTDNL